MQTALSDMASLFRARRQALRGARLAGSIALERDRGKCVIWRVSLTVAKSPRHRAEEGAFQRRLVGDRGLPRNSCSALRRTWPVVSLQPPTQPIEPGKQH